MPNLKLADPDRDVRIASPLARCLVQLDARPAATASIDVPVDREESIDGGNAEEGCIPWQKRWKANQELISSRLAMIQEELDRLDESDLAAPHLSVFEEPGT